MKNRFIAGGVLVLALILGITALRYRWQPQSSSVESASTNLTAPDGNLRNTEGSMGNTILPPNAGQGDDVPFSERELGELVEQAKEEVSAYPVVIGQLLEDIARIEALSSEQLKAMQEKLAEMDGEKMYREGVTQSMSPSTLRSVLSIEKNGVMREFEQAMLNMSHPKNLDAFTRFMADFTVEKMDVERRLALELIATHSRSSEFMQDNLKNMGAVVRRAQGKETPPTQPLGSWPSPIPGLAFALEGLSVAELHELVQLLSNPAKQQEMAFKHGVLSTMISKLQ